VHIPCACNHELTLARWNPRLAPAIAPIFAQVATVFAKITSILSKIPAIFTAIEAILDPIAPCVTGRLGPCG
jgi:hypothetical protein